MSSGIERCVCNAPFAPRTNGLGQVYLECGGCQTIVPVTRRPDPYPDLYTDYISTYGQRKRRRRDRRSVRQREIAALNLPPSPGAEYARKKRAASKKTPGRAA